MKNDQKEIVVIGGGAAGFFAAINTAQKDPALKVTILEKSSKLLSKVRISGGGRCNVTHHCFETAELIKNYPRGHKELRQVFSRFAVKETIDWFRKHQVDLKSETDGRMFPVTDNSETIISCFLDLAKKLNIRIELNCEVFAINRSQDGFELKTNHGVKAASMVICASGGHPKSGSYDFLKNLGHTIDAPIPSLFTFNLPQTDIRKLLQGVSVSLAGVTIPSFKQSYQGPMLITHWGLSGPAILKLSAFAAKELHEANYETKVRVNWVYPFTLHETEEELKTVQQQKGKTYPVNSPLFNLPKRLWEYLCASAGTGDNKPWAEQSKKTIQLLAATLTASEYQMQGKTTFKEEFVTAGGVHLKEVDFKTMQSKIVPGLYFCGEVLNIDGITGGFNFQSAWSTAWACASAITE